MLQGWREHQIDSAGRQIIHWSSSGGNRVERRSAELSTCRGNRSYNWLGLQLRHQLFTLRINIYMYVNTITIISIISNTDLVRVLLEYALNQKILKVSQDLSTSFPPLLGFRPRREDPPWCNFSFSLLTPVAAQ